MVETGKLTANVQTLITEVGTLRTSVGGLRDNVSFVKGALWAIGIGIPIVMALLAWVLNGKLDAFIEAAKVVSKAH
jgi:hypothetical protein